MEKEKEKKAAPVKRVKKASPSAETVKKKVVMVTVPQSEIDDYKKQIAELKEKHKTFVVQSVFNVMGIMEEFENMSVFQFIKHKRCLRKIKKAQ